MFNLILLLIIVFVGYTGYKTYKQLGTISPLDTFFEAFVKNLKFWQR